MAICFDLTGHSTRILYYPQGAGGPPGIPSSAKVPSLEYIDGAQDVSASGTELTVSPSPAGTFVTAIIKKTRIVPGGVTSFSVLIPDINVVGQSPVTIKTLGVLAVHRGTANIGPGQLESYSELPLTGTASNLLSPV